MMNLFSSKTPLQFEIGLARPSASRIMNGDIGLSPECRSLIPWNEPHFGNTFRGFGSNFKILSAAPYRSMLSNDLRTLLDADPTIVDYAAYPHVLEYQMFDSDDGWVWKTFSPDLVVRLKSRQSSTEIVVVEVRAEDLQNNPSWTKRVQYINHAYWFDHGVRFFVYGESDIQTEPKLSNCKRLNASRWFAVRDDRSLDRILQVANELMPEDHSTTTVEQLVVAADIPPEPPRYPAIEAIANAVLEGALFIDHRVRWTPKSLLYRKPVQ